MALHGGVECGEINPDTARAQGILRQIEREAERIVEREGDFALELVARVERRGFLFEDRKAALQGAAEPGLLELEVSVISASARMSSG